MATRTSSQSGNWSSTSTWGGEAVPANGDTVIISTGHDVVFDVNQSGFANGLLSMVVNGTLRFKVDAVTYLKMNGNITGTGELYVGNSEVDPIQRPPSGTESRCTLMFNATGTIDVPVIRMYGWYPEREFTQLDADAALNATTIVLKEDLGLQAGDKIYIGTGAILGNTNWTTPSDSNVYTVQSYNSETKTVNLTSGLKINRLQDDYVAISSRPVLIRRSTGEEVLFSKINNLKMIGVKTTTKLIFNSDWSISKNNIFKHSTLAAFIATELISNSSFEDCTIEKIPIGSGSTINFKRCGLFSEGISYIGNSQMYAYNLLIEDCVAQNMNNVFTSTAGFNISNIIKNSEFKSHATFTWGGGTFINCELSGQEWDGNPRYWDTSQGFNEINMINCILNSINNNPFFSISYGKIYNTLFNVSGDILLDTYNIDRPQYLQIESFNHNQIPGNYKAWMRGGRIITEDNKLKFICESNDYPVFRDYPVLAPANRVAKFLIALTKDTAGIVSKLQIIDPSNDPLIDSTATPLAESTAQNNTDSQQLGIAYKSTTPKQLILRILCKNSTGNVVIDTNRIDQSLVKKITSLN